MNSALTTHPPREHLLAFAHGKMSVVHLDEIAKHLGECESCAKAVSDAPDDRLVVELRDLTMSIGSSGDDTVRPKLSDSADFELGDVLGRGGMGVVYLARQKSVSRDVAFKLIRSADADPLEIGRFKAEAEAAAKLQHPNIVQLHQTGVWDGQPFIVMEYLTGGRLSDKLRDAPLPPKRAAEMCQTLAHAIHYAHEKGIIHRDLKPSNVLLTEKGEPKISDFGLVKRVDVEVGQTQTGDVLGTPSYMPPEQALGKVRELTATADVYSLGATLYEMITGRTPFKADNQYETLKQVIHTDPVPPTRLQPSIPTDLETICLKCLEKDPQKRYASAQALADDLGRFLRGEPTLARPVSTVGRFWRWCRRNPAVAALTMIAASLLLIGTFVSSSLAVWAFYQRDRANQKTSDYEIENAKFKVQKNEALKQTKIAIGEAEKAKKQKTKAEVASKNAKAATIDAQKQTAAAVAAKKLAEDAKKEAVASQKEAVASQKEAEAATRKTQNQLFTMTLDKANAHRENGHLFKSLPYLASSLQILESMKDPDRVAIGVHRRRIGSTLAQCPKLAGYWRHADSVVSVAFSPDGRFVLTAGYDGRAALLDVEKGGVVSVMRHPARVTCAAFSHDGQLAATGCDDRQVRVFKPTTKEVVVPPLNLGRAITHVEFSPVDSSFLIAAGGDRFQGQTQQKVGNIYVPRFPRGIARVWNVRSGDVVATKTQSGWTNHATFNPEGRLGAMAGGRMMNTRDVIVWELPYRRRALHALGMTLGTSRIVPVHVAPWLHTRPSLRLLSPRLSVKRVAFSPDGKLIAAACGDIVAGYGLARVWRTFDGIEHVEPLQHAKSVTQVSFSPDGRFLLTASDDGMARVWHAETGRSVPRAMLHTDAITSAVFSADSRRVLTASMDGTARVWDAATGKPVSPYFPHSSPVLCAAFSPDCRRIVTGSENGAVRVWDLAETTAYALELKHDANRIRYVSFAGMTPNGHIVTASANIVRGSATYTGGSSRAWEQKWLENNRIWFWDAKSNELLGEVPHSGPQFEQLLSPDRTTLLTLSKGDAKNPSTVSIWRLPSMEPLTWTLPPGAGISEYVGGVGFLSNRYCYVNATRRLSPAGKDVIRNFYVLDTKTAELVDTVPAPPGWMADAALDHEKNRLIVLTFPRRPDLPNREKENKRNVEHSVGVYVFDWKDGKAWENVANKVTLKAGVGVRFIGASPNGKRIITATDHWARIWSSETGVELTPRLEHSLPIRFAAFSPDGRYVVTVGADKSARVWDSQSGKAVTPPLVHRADVLYASFSADSKQVATGSADGAVRIWPLRDAVQSTNNIVELSRILSDHQLDKTGGLVPLDLESFGRTWAKLRKNDPTVFSPSQVAVLRWHQQQADEALLEKNAKGSAVHLGYILKHKQNQWLYNKDPKFDTLEFLQQVAKDYERITEIGEPSEQTQMLGAWLYQNISRFLRRSKGADEAAAKAKRLFETLDLTLLHKGELKSSDGPDRVRPGSFHRTHTIKLENGRTYQFDTVSKHFDTYLYLQDQKGKTLSQDDDGGDAFNSRLVYRAKRSGEHKLIVTSFGEAQTGVYALTIRKVRPGRIQVAKAWNPPVAPTSELTIGRTYRGTLTAADELDTVKIGSRRKVHVLELQAGKKYRIDLKSANFDTFLRLEDEKTRSLDTDDDGGGGLNSRLEFTPKKTGRYRIIVTTFGRGMIGVYTLLVHEYSSQQNR